MNIEKESDILRIVKEDILEALQRKNGKVPSSLIESEIRVSRSFIFKAIRELEKEGLIKFQQNSILLTKTGKDRAKDIVKKHLILESYFKRTRTEKEAHQIAHILEHYISKQALRNIKKLSTLKEKGISLVKFELKKEAIISDVVFPDFRLFERMISMGIFPGEKIKITNKLPNSVIVKIKNKKFALAKKIAKGIKVLKI
jgi:Mn-dependent DtxR family transcriptional regulator